MTDIFKCPKCNAEFERSEHYKATIHSLNMINMMTGNPEIIIDFCGKCTHEVKKE